jgi:hypothetical protein
MGHSGSVTDQLEELVSSSLLKLENVCAQRYLTLPLPCSIREDCVTLGALNIKSFALSKHLNGCAMSFLFAATLGADVDRLISQRVKIDSTEALCLQACAAAKIEEYCDNMENELSNNGSFCNLRLRRRFSPGYGDFDIAHQTDILRMLNAQNRIGVSETKTHMLTPLKSVTAVIGAGFEEAASKSKCDDCGKKDCPFSKKEAHND